MTKFSKIPVITRRHHCLMKRPKDIQNKSVTRKLQDAGEILFTFSQDIVYVSFEKDKGTLRKVSFTCNICINITA